MVTQTVTFDHGSDCLMGSVLLNGKRVLKGMVRFVLTKADNDILDKALDTETPFLVNVCNVIDSLEKTDEEKAKTAFICGWTATENDEGLFSHTKALMSLHSGKKASWLLEIATVGARPADSPKSGWLMPFVVLGAFEYILNDDHKRKLKRRLKQQVN